MNALYANDTLIALADSLNNLKDAANGNEGAMKEGLWYYFAAQGMVASYAFLNFDRASASIIFNQMLSLSPSLRVTEQEFLSACDFEFGLLGNNN